MKKHNFYAGPAILPTTAVENTAKAVLDFNGIGMSLMEISHGSKEFKAVMDEARAMFKEPSQCAGRLFGVLHGWRREHTVCPYSL